jgi:hypothetical protein
MGIFIFDFLLKIQVWLAFTQYGNLKLCKTFHIICSLCGICVDSVLRLKLRNKTEKNVVIFLQHKNDRRGRNSAGLCLGMINF